MLSKLEGLALNKAMRNIAKAIENEDYRQIMLHATSLKAPCGYTGVSRVYNTCIQIAKSYHNHNYTTMKQFYPQLVEHAIEFKIYYRKHLAEMKHEDYKPLPEHDKISLAKGYYLKKDPITGRV